MQMSGNMKQKLSEFFEGLKGGDKKSPKEAMLILFLSGILIYVILIPVDSGKENIKEKNQTTSTIIEENDIYAGDEYKKQLEKELEDFLSQIKGMGKVKVLIYMKNSQEYIVEKDVPATISEGADNKESIKDETTVYTVNDSGEQVPFVAQTVLPDIDGVVIAAQGASDEGIRLQIFNLVKALYGLEVNKIDVFVLNE